MRSLKTGWLALVASALIGVFALGAGEVKKGEELFKNPHLGGSRNDTSCNTCHPDGKGLHGVAEKKEFKTPAGTSTKLEVAINQCITMALKGKELPDDSKEMKDLVAYLDSLKAEKPTK